MRTWSDFSLTAEDDDFLTRRRRETNLENSRSVTHSDTSLDDSVQFQSPTKSFLPASSFHPPPPLTNVGRKLWNEEGE